MMQMKNTEKKEQKEQFRIELTVEQFLKDYFEPEMTAARCRACSGFGKTWACPDFAFAPQDFWERFTTYTVLVERLWVADSADAEEAQERLQREKKGFNRRMLELEKACGGTALYAQECEACTTCARLDGEPCRLPQIMRYSIEALGGNAEKLIRDKLGFAMQWSHDGSVPEYYLLIGGLLR